MMMLIVRNDNIGYTLDMKMIKLLIIMILLSLSLKIMIRRSNTIIANNMKIMF